MDGEFGQIDPSAALKRNGPAAGGEERKPLILLVDDSADMREYVRELLSGRFDVVVACNGRQALEAARRVAPDLVLTVEIMPEMDGFELLSAIRDDPSLRTTPVIMLSTGAGKESCIEGLDAGADDYLTKPFTARELMARVEAQLKMARLRREAVEQQSAWSREVQQ